MNERKWVRRSLRVLAQALQEKGYSTSHMTVRRLLKQARYSLKGNRKQWASSSPERDTQFRYLTWVRQCFEAAGHPVISVDTKKKELIGNFKNAGQVWCQVSEAVNIHDFLQDASGRAVPYGLYDPGTIWGMGWWATPRTPPNLRWMLSLNGGKTHTVRLSRMNAAC